MKAIYPGASERTLARMRLLGTDGDHEAMTIEEVEARLLHGYAVTLRHSSIRPDLPHLLKEIVEKELRCVRSYNDDNGWFDAFIPYRWCDGQMYSSCT